MKARRMLLVAGIAIAVLAVPAALQGAGVDAPGVTQNAQALADICTANHSQGQDIHGTYHHSCEGVHVVIEDP